MSWVDRLWRRRTVAAAGAASPSAVRRRQVVDAINARPEVIARRRAAVQLREKEQRAERLACVTVRDRRDMRAGGFV
ncbi:hypothetical protein [Sciscionella marina]|uniref:hypothetical protein n=1 Tax=Sciscionella marina TaxID=508770 RepID=UPI0012F6F186|nr:hypothetical protein [Sciscionella marina]